jgi:hypothetical protein
MVTKIMEWASFTALVLWRPVANHQLPLDLVVCVGSVLVALALFLTKQGIEIHCDVDNRYNPASRVAVKVRAWRH